jgi:hypothetical protein
MLALLALLSGKAVEKASVAFMPKTHTASTKMRSCRVSGPKGTFHGSFAIFGILLAFISSPP